MDNAPETPSNPRPSRPFSVWIISVWYFMSGFFSISMIAAVQSRIASLPAPVDGVLPPTRLETGDLILAAFLIALNLTGAGFLFLLRRISVFFLKAALALNVGSNLWYIAHRGLGEQPLVMGAGVVLGWLVAAVVCRHAANLARNGVLR